VTDAERNIYTLSAVGITSINIDGNAKTGFGDSTTLTDYVISSFSCDGTYRWSKIIGGGGNESIMPLQIDASGNIYVGGKFTTCNGTNGFPARIENDIILDQTESACSLLFLAKFNSDGILQWFVQPQAEVASTISYGQSSSNEFFTNADGSTTWLIKIPPGSYANGAFINTMEGSNYFVFKYDTDGNYTGNTYLNMQLEYSAARELQFNVNPYNGNYYFTSGRDQADTAVVGGQAITNGFFMFAFDSTGQFLWKRENTSTTKFEPFNLEFDADNNIYLGGRYIGDNMTSFLGFSVTPILTPGFLMKINSNGDAIIWSSYSNKNVQQRGALKLKGNEIAFTGTCMQTFAWAGQSIYVNAIGQGLRALLARFNTNDGSAIALDFIQSDNGYPNIGTALEVDTAGDYILGGGFGGTQTFTTNSISYVGGQSDFFVTKYSTATCAPLEVAEHQTDALQIFPNPGREKVTISVPGNTTYSIFTITGALILKGEISANSNEVNISALQPGVYLVHLQGEDGAETVRKLVKE
jgi:hypothetical protein